MAKGVTIDSDIDSKRLLDQSSAIAAKLEELSMEEKQEWMEIQVNKLRQIGRRLG